MKPEELFLAIGEVEGFRLERSEQAGSPSNVIGLEEHNMKKTTNRRMLRNLLIAAVIVSMLGVTAFAVGGFLIFESPEQLLTAVFGDNTGFDHSDGSITKDPWGGPEGILVEPTFDRVPADEAVVEEDVAPLVSPVGRSISNGTATLTVDAYMYDSITRCGLLTYTLENSAGVTYQLQTNGEVWYQGVDPVKFSQYGYSYIIEEKSTDTRLAATYYFQYDRIRGDTLEISFHEEETLTDDQIYALLVSLEEEIRQEFTGAEAVEAVKEKMGAARFAESAGDRTEEELAEYAYTVLTHEKYEEQTKKGERITVSFTEDSKLSNVTMAEGAVTVTPICIQVDVTNLDFLHVNKVRVHADNVDSVRIRYTDGTEYVVSEDYVMNYLFAHNTSATDGEEDTSNQLTYMFNRIIDVDAVESVIINGVELPVD